MHLGVGQIKLEMLVICKWTFRTQESVFSPWEDFMVGVMAWGVIIYGG